MWGQIHNWKRGLRLSDKLLYLVVLSIVASPVATLYGASVPLFSYAESAGDWLGENIANAGDVNSDGIDDIIVGARHHRGTHGLASVISGADGSVLYRYVGLTNVYLGSSVAGVGDINDDGYDDFAIGEIYLPFGKVIVHSGIDGAILLTIEGGQYGTVGWAVAGIGDVNNDDVPDIGVGVNGIVRIHSGSDGSHLFTVYADVTGWTGFGDDLAGAGDVNADGHDDIIIGAMYQNNTCLTGKAYVYSGLDGSLLYKYSGVNCGDYVGMDVAGVGDLNSDGYADFAVGQSNAVKVYSGIDGTELYDLRQHGSSLWMTLSGIDDIDGDGIPDIVTGIHDARYMIYSGATGLRAAWSGWLNPIMTDVIGGRVVGVGDFDGDGIPDVAFSDYLNDGNGEDAGIIYGLAITPGVDCCRWRGDLRADGRINIADITFAIARIFAGGSATACPEDADANADGSFNIGDITFLISVIFAGSETLQSCIN